MAQRSEVAESRLHRTIASVDTGFQLYDSGLATRQFVCNFVTIRQICSWSFRFVVDFSVQYDSCSADSVRRRRGRPGQDTIRAGPKFWTGRVLSVSARGGGRQYPSIPFRQLAVAPGGRRTCLTVHH